MLEPAPSTHMHTCAIACKSNLWLTKLAHNLPGGFRIEWVQMKMTKPDYSQHYLRGTPPTVAVEYTLEGLQAGKDEVLEKALEVARNRPN